MWGKNGATFGGRVPERMTLLAVVQALLVLCCGLSAGGVVGATQYPARQAILAGLFAVAVVLSLTWSAHGLSLVLQLDLAMTSVLIAAATLLQPTSEGQLVLGLFVLVVAMWSASFLPWRQAVAQFALAAALYAVALLAGPTTGTPAYGLAILVSAALAGLVVMRGRAAGSRYSGLVSKAVDVVLLSTDGRWTWASAGIEEELGWTPQEFLELEDPIWHPDDEATVSDVRRRVEAGEPVTATYRLRHKDGRYRWVEARVSPTGGSEGQAGTVWLLREVTEHMQAERALARSSFRNRRVLQGLRRKDEAKTQQFHDLSHELRAPLTVIRGPLERHLERGDDLPEDLRTDLAAAVRAGRRLEGIVDGVLDIAQSDGEPSKPAPVPADAATVTSECVRLLRPAAEAAGLTLSLETDAHFPEGLQIDSDAWSTIVLNLLSNAVKYTSDGGVRVRLTAEADHVVLQVTDTGRGIEEQEVSRIFDRLYTAGLRPPRDDARSGLGLALTAEAVDAAGGHIDVTSEVGVGTTIVVTVPAPPSGPVETKAADAAGTDGDVPADVEPPTPEERMGDALGELMAEEELSVDEAMAVLKARSDAGEDPRLIVAADVAADDADANVAH